MLTYPTEWGPTEWGPIPFLPEPDVLVRSMEAQWGDLAAYRGMATSASGDSGFTSCNMILGRAIAYKVLHFATFVRVVSCHATSCCVCVKLCFDGNCMRTT